jgi:indole-3-glycerol phosphate synthase
MSDFLDVLARDAKVTVASGYYKSLPQKAQLHPASLKAAIISTCAEGKKAAVITEVKAASPSAGTIKEEVDAGTLSEEMAKGGAVGISVLTEPKHFNGSLTNLREVRANLKLPILMKDIVVSSEQLAAAAKIGANVVLLIQALFDRGYCEESLSEMVRDAHARKLEVLLEAHNTEEFHRAVASDADLVGINNRDLGTLKVDLDVTKRILQQNSLKCKLVISESGIKNASDIRFLRACGADAFLVGSSVMLSNCVEEKVRELVQSLSSENRIKSENRILRTKK